MNCFDSKFAFNFNLRRYNMVQEELCLVREETQDDRLRLVREQTEGRDRLRVVSAEASASESVDSTADSTVSGEGLTARGDSGAEAAAGGAARVARASSDDSGGTTSAVLHEVQGVEEVGWCKLMVSKLALKLESAHGCSA